MNYSFRSNTAAFVRSWTFVISSLLLCLVLLRGTERQQPPAHAERAQYSQAVERWGIEEITCHSTASYENPFRDVVLTGTFTHELEIVTVRGFFDGTGTWHIRFMPESQGVWTFMIGSNEPTLDGIRGSFTAVEPKEGNHGPVRVANTYHFSYADGTPLFVLGTTIYNWINRDDELQEQTLQTLAHEPFNKVRFLIFPKWFVYNRVEPKYFPFIRRADGTFDFDRFDVRYFNKLDLRISELQSMGIEADIILFHPYDHWGFNAMNASQDDQYVRYVSARLSAYRNVWWTMANEYDLFDPSLSKGQRPPKDWDHLGRVLAAGDPFHHLIGVHDIATWYDAKKPWVTHVVDQDGTHHPNLAVPVGRFIYHKPVLVDEYGYEGNNGEGWGDFDARTIVRQHWELTMAGGYGSHGETFVHPGGILWWSDGGELAGDSPSRLGFLKWIMTEAPFQQLEPAPELVFGGSALKKSGEYSLFYFEHSGEVQIKLPGSGVYKGDLIDPWQMKIYAMGSVTAGAYAINIHMVPCLLRFVREKVSKADDGGPTLREKIDRFAGELSTPAQSTPFHPEERHLTPQYTLNLLLLIPPAREAIHNILPGLKLDGINPALTLQEIIDNPKNGITSSKAQEVTRAMSQIKAY